MGAAGMKRKEIPLSENLKDVLIAEPHLDLDGAPEWLSEEREQCRKQLLERSLPGQGLEAWKYTDVSALTSIDWQLPLHKPDAADCSQVAPSTADNQTLHVTLLNGSYIPLEESAMPEGIKIRQLANGANLDSVKPVLQRTNYRMESFFAVLNRAIWHDGVYIRIAPETRINLHIHLAYGGIGHTAVLSAPRVYIKAGEHSEASITLSQWNRNPNPSFGTACVDIDVSAGAHVTYTHDQQLNTEAFQFTTTRIGVGCDATLHAIDLASGAVLSRHDLSVSLQESGSEAHLNGIYLLRDRQTADFHTLIEHRKPHGNSRQVYKGVLDDHAHAVFNGLVEVHPGASGTDGYQLNRTLLRSPHAVIDTKPELQIHNDDVKCSHGANIGQLDPMELFYLQSRSIPTDLAKAILSRAFVADLVHQQPSPYQQKRLHDAVEAYFNKI
jgi:Fe-S cluster assembly protein SufD